MIGAWIVAGRKLRKPEPAEPLDQRAAVRGIARAARRATTFSQVLLEG